MRVGRSEVGLERNGVSEAAQTALKRAFKILFREGLTVSNALAKIEREVPVLPETDAVTVGGVVSPPCTPWLTQIGADHSTLPSSCVTFA